MLGIDRLGYWAREFGFGATTGVDLPNEVSGIVPTNQWKLDALGEPIFPGELYQAGIGQAYDVVTPIQLRDLAAPKSVLKDMREATRNVQLIRHTSNLVDLPIVMAGKSGNAELGGLPFHSWFVALSRRTRRSTLTIRKA